MKTMIDKLWHMEQRYYIGRKDEAMIYAKDLEKNHEQQMNEHQKTLVRNVIEKAGKVS